jgi:hypothetical protein
MRNLLRYTLDLFEPAAPVEPARKAPKIIAFAGPQPLHKPGQVLSLAIDPAAFAHPRANRSLRLGDAIVAYLFERAKRRTIGFVVGPDGLTVRAPRWTPIPEVEAALLEKAPWITRKLNETRERQARQTSARIEWRDGAVLPFLGLKIAVALDSSHGFAGAGAQLEPAKEGCELHILRVGLPHSAAPEQIKDAVQAWLMRQAKTHFTQRLDHFAPLVQVQWQQLRLSNASTRWGSARIDGSIRLNWRLVHFTPAVIDYVVVHELSHLRVMDHSPRFWDAVGAVVPDYASLRKQLKDDTTPKW